MKDQMIHMDGIDFIECARCHAIKDKKWFYLLKKAQKYHSWCVDCCKEMAANYRVGIDRKLEKALAPWHEGCGGKATIKKSVIKKSARKVVDRRISNDQRV